MGDWHGRGRGALCLCMTRAALQKLAMALRLAAEALDEWDGEEPAKVKRLPKYRTPRRPAKPTEQEAATVTDVAMVKAERALKRQGLL